MSTIMPSPEVRRYRERCARLFGNVCYFCKNTFHEDDLTLEHLIPIKRGGSVRSLENHALACEQCNNNKACLTVAEYCIVFNRPYSDFDRYGKLKEGVMDILPITDQYTIALLSELR